MSERDCEDVQLARLWEICDLERERDEAWQSVEAIAVQLAQEVIRGDGLRQTLEAATSLLDKLAVDNPGDCDLERMVRDCRTTLEDSRGSLDRLRRLETVASALHAWDRPASRRCYLSGRGPHGERRWALL